MTNTGIPSHLRCRIGVAETNAACRTARQRCDTQNVARSVTTQSCRASQHTFQSRRNNRRDTERAPPTRTRRRNARRRGRGLASTFPRGFRPGWQTGWKAANEHHRKMLKENTVTALISELGKHDLALLLYLSPKQTGDFPAAATVVLSTDADDPANFSVLLVEDEGLAPAGTGTSSPSSDLTAVLMETLDRLRDEGTAVPSDGGPAWGRDLVPDRMRRCQSMIAAVAAVWPDAADPVTVI